MGRRMMSRSFLEVARKGAVHPARGPKNLGQPVKNRFKVPAKQWNRWSNHARSVFNKLYWAMRPSCQSLFAAHPKALPMPREQWDTIRWNVSWWAADIAEGRKNGK